MKRIISFVLFICLVTGSALAQPHKDRRSKIDWDKYKAQKISFITERIELDTKTSEKFWPVYNDFEKKLITTMRARRAFDHELKSDIDKLSDKELIKLSWRMTELAEKEVEVRKKSNEKFLEILSPKQVVLLYQAEQEFRAHLLSTYGNKRMQMSTQGKEKKRE